MQRGPPRVTRAASIIPNQEFEHDYVTRDRQHRQPGIALRLDQSTTLTEARHEADRAKAEIQKSDYVAAQHRGGRVDRTLPLRRRGVVGVAQGRRDHRQRRADDRPSNRQSVAVLGRPALRHGPQPPESRSASGGRRDREHPKQLRWSRPLRWCMNEILTEVEDNGSCGDS